MSLLKDLEDGINEMAKDAKMEGIKAGIKLVLENNIPPQMREHLPKFIDVSVGIVDWIKSILGNDEKRILITTDGDGNVRIILIDSTQPFMISKEENYWVSVPFLGAKDDLGMNINQARENIINEFVLPLIPEQYRSQIGKFDEAGMKQAFQEFSKSHMNFSAPGSGEVKHDDINPTGNEGGSVRQLPGNDGN